MESKDYWLNLWKKGDLPFHQTQINPFLEKYWPQLHVPHMSRVLVPLCGKTSDLISLVHAGHFVVGVELSEIASQAFFEENHIPYKIEQIGNFKRYYSSKIEIYCGDFFKLPSLALPPFRAVFDRASLIALPEELRKPYVETITHALEKNGEILLIVYESPNEIKAHPYPIPLQEIKFLYEENFLIKQCEVKQSEVSEFLHGRGYTEVYHVVYHLKKL